MAEEASTPRWARAAGVVLLLAPFLVAPLSVGRVPPERESLGADQLSVHLLRAAGLDRLLLWNHYRPEVRVLDLEGQRLGQLEPGRDSDVEGPIYLDGEWLLRFGGSFGRPSSIAHLGRLPLRGGEAFAVSYALPAEVAVRLTCDHPAALVLPEPVALACGSGKVMVRTVRGWAELAERPGRRLAGRERLPVPPLRSAPPEGCRPMQRIEELPPVAVGTAILEEVQLDDGLYVLGAPNVPPSHLALRGPDGRLDRVVCPPRDRAAPGAAMIGGRWALFYGRACEVGELRLTLVDLKDPERRPYVWTKLLPMRPFLGCRADLLPVVWVCDGRGLLQLQTPDGPRAFAVPGAEELTPLSGPELAGCERLRPMSRGVATWRAARTLSVGEDTYHVSDGPPTLTASRHGRVLWAEPLPAPGLLLGTTDERVLLVTPPNQLILMDRASGKRRGILREGALRDATEDAPSVLRWGGSLGHRAFWIAQSDTSRLAIFDGARLRWVE